jgi:hypothetical protein
MLKKSEKIEREVTNNELAMMIKAGFDGVDMRFEGFDARFDEVDKRFEAVDKRFDEVDRRFDCVERRLGHLEQDKYIIDKVKEALAL